MSYATATDIQRDTIPVIDISPLPDGEPQACRALAAQIQAAAEAVGFFYVRGHGVPAPLIADAFRVSREFFDLAPQMKDRVRVSDKKRGYIPPRTARMTGATTRDFRETFLWGREFDARTLADLAAVPLMGPNQWPDFPPAMQPALSAYFEACIALGRRLLRLFALALDIEPDYFSHGFERTMSRGSTLYYPPQSAEQGAEQFGIGPHTDWGVLTLLYQDQVGGLQVCGRNGEWLAAHPIDNTFVVNVGDCLERWTNRRFLSNGHRVVNASGRGRQAIAVFVDPDFDTAIVPVVKPGEAAHYPPTTCGAQVLESFRKAYGS